MTSSQFKSRIILKSKISPNNRIITLSGNPGSGKSTVAKILKELLGFERVYVGGMMRELARERGMTINEFMDYALHHPEIDQEADLKAAAEARKLAAERKGVIVEGRMQFHFFPESFKVFVKVDPEEGAKRIWRDLQQSERSTQRNEGPQKSLPQVQKMIMQREEVDAQRYKKLYGLDHRSPDQYDLVIDSTSRAAEEVAREIVNVRQKLLKKQKPL